LDTVGLLTVIYKTVDEFILSDLMRDGIGLA
jgi:hypothetical protein